jgi:hypothetical protein
VINFGAVKLNRKSDFIINKTFSRCWSFHQQQKAGVEWLVRKLKDIFLWLMILPPLLVKIPTRAVKIYFF